MSEPVASADTSWSFPGASGPMLNPAWDDAFSRVEGYLRAHQIESRLVLNHIATGIIHEAHRKAQLGGGGDPLALTMQEAERRTEAWFRRVLGDAIDPDDDRMGARGRIALVLTDVPARWPQHFLADTEPPPELVGAMRAAYIEAGPQMQLTSMVPRPMDFGPIANVADEAWKTFARWPVLRAMIGWALFVGLLAFLWWLTH
ncbi:MAG: hypothetical protein EAZ36_06945 [Verrucomicrobia bacterium]|nr:MAG: hypothetical protein EAZ36_06945 [Verrucomicrobiota bacterium]